MGYIGEPIEIDLEPLDVPGEVPIETPAETPAEAPAEPVPA